MDKSRVVAAAFCAFLLVTVIARGANAASCDDIGDGFLREACKKSCDGLPGKECLPIVGCVDLRGACNDLKNKGMEALRRVEEEAKRAAQAAREAKEKLEAEVRKAAERLRQEKERLEREAKAFKDRVEAELKRKAAELLSGAKNAAEKKIRELIQQAMTKVTDTVSAAKKTVTDAVQAAISTLNPIVERARKAAQDGISSALKAVADGLSKQFQPLSKCFKDFPAFIQRLAATAGGAAAAGGEALAGAVRKANEFVEGELKKGIERLHKVGSDLIAAVTAGVAAAESVVDEARKAAQKILEGNVVGAITSALSGNFSGIGTALGKAVGQINGAISKLANNVATAVGATKTAIEGSVSGAIAAGKSALEAAKKGAAQVAGGLAPTLGKLLEAASKYGEDALGMAKCVYNFAKHNLGISALPDFAQLEGGVKTALDVGGRLFKAAQSVWNDLQDPKKRDAAQASLRQQLEGMGKEFLQKAMSAAAEGIPKLMQFIQEFKSDIRSVLVLEGVKDVFDDRGDKTIVDAEGQQRKPNVIIDALFNRVAGLIKDPINKLAENLGMRSLVEASVNALTDPLRQGFRVAMRTMALVRTALKSVVEQVLPKILEGGNTIVANIKRAIDALRRNVPPAMADMVSTGLDKVIDIITPLAAFLAEQLGLKDTVAQVLDAIVGGFEDVQSLTKLNETMKGAKSGDAVLGALKDAASEAKAAALGKLAQADADKAQQVAETAQRTLSAAEQALLTALSTAALDASARPARDQRIKTAQGKVDAARTAADKANQEYTAALRRAAHLDPDAAQKKIIIAGWEKISEAFMKLTWDVFMAIYAKFIDDYLTVLKLYVGVYAGVIGTVLHVCTVTVTWTPWIAEIAGVAINMFLSVYQGFMSLYFAMIVPEYRTLVKDQLVSLRNQFVGMLSKPDTRKTLETSIALAKDIAADLGPIVDRLKAVRDKMAMGSSALMTGPIGDVLKTLPPELVAAMTKAISQGIKLLQNMGTEALKEGAKMLVGGKGNIQVPKPEDVAKMVVKIMKDPLIDFFVGLVPDDAPWPPLKTAMKAFLVAALKGVEDNPMQAVNPSEILKRIGDGIASRNAQDAFADFLVAAGAKAFEKMADVGSCMNANEDGTVAAAGGGAAGTAMEALRGLARDKVKKVAGILTPTPDFSKIMTLLSGGVLGLLREVVHGTKGFMTCLMVKQIPDDPPGLKTAMRDAVHRGFLTIESRGEFERVIGKGWQGVVARLVDLAREPAVLMLLKDVPEGKAKAAVRAALRALTAEDKVGRLLELLSKGGIPGVLGEVLTTDAVANALGELIAGDLAEMTLSDGKPVKERIAAKLKQRGGELVAAPGKLPEGFLKKGLGDLVVLAAEAIEAWLGAQLTAKIANPKLKEAVLSALRAGREALMGGPGSLAAVLKSVGAVILGRLKTYLAELKTKAAGKANAAVTAAFQSLDFSMQRVPLMGTAPTEALSMSALVPTLASDLEVLGSLLPAEVLP